jgi:ABC-type lipoprotein export system ATPase subunit
MPDRIFQLEDVIKTYETGAGGFTALKGINLEVRGGEFLGIVGKSGAGKSTLLNMISGVSSITSGRVLFYPQTYQPNNGRGKPLSIGEMSQDELAVWRGKNMGIVYQSFELLPQLDLMNNIMLPQQFAGRYRGALSQKQAMTLLEQVELTEHAHKLPAHISGGQKQRIAIARALINDPAVIIADEPTGNLDTVTSETIFRIFENLVAGGKTIILVTHDDSLVARFSRVVYISDGELVESYGKRITVDQHDNGKSPQLLESIALATEKQVNGHNGRARAWAKRQQSQGDCEADKERAEGRNNNCAIILRDVVKTYVNAAGKFPALKGINMRVGYGQFISLVGKSGCGKSTLLNMLTGIDHPTSGEVIVGGKNIYEMTESQRALWRGRNVGIVFQFFQLLPTLTLLENTMLPMDYCNIYPSIERPKRAMDLLAMVGLEEHAHKLPASVSSGQQQSAAIARALATDPPLIVADEPTGNLDSRSAKIILLLFSNLAEQGKTILLVTHDPSFTKVTDQTIILSDGEIVDGAVAEALPLLSHPQMLDATRQAEKRQYQPGSIIIQQGQQLDHLYMIASGAVDVLLNSPGCPEVSLARLGEGQFFGEISLLQGGVATASVRAAGPAPVNLSLIPREGFHQLLQESPSTQEMVERVAQIRFNENQARNGDCEGR